MPQKVWSYLSPSKPSLSHVLVDNRDVLREGDIANKFNRFFEEERHLKRALKLLRKAEYSFTNVLGPWDVPGCQGTAAKVPRGIRHLGSFVKLSSEFIGECVFLVNVSTLILYFPTSFPQ